MKARIVPGVLAFAVLITMAHVWANIGLLRFADDIREALGWKRPTLTVGFLPVT